MGHMPTTRAAAALRANAQWIKNHLRLRHGKQMTAMAVTSASASTATDLTTGGARCPRRDVPPRATGPENAMKGARCSPSAGEPRHRRTAVPDFAEGTATIDALAAAIERPATTPYAATDARRRAGRAGTPAKKRAHRSGGRGAKASIRRGFAIAAALTVFARRRRDVSRSHELDNDRATAAGSSSCSRRRSSSVPGTSLLPSFLDGAEASGGGHEPLIALRPGRGLDLHGRALPRQTSSRTPRTGRYRTSTS